MRGILIALMLVLFGGHALRFWHLDTITWVERGLHDWRVQTQHPVAVHPQVVILDVDERSLAELGRWPWPRDQLARVMDLLFGPDCQKMQALGLDMILAEPDRKPGADAQLAKIMRRCPVVMGWYLSSQSDAIASSQVPMPAMFEEDLRGFITNQGHWKGHTANLPMFDAVANSGLINALLDSDGIQRRVPLLMAYEGNLHESLALSLWRSTLPPHSLRLGPSPHPEKNNTHPEYLEIVFPMNSEQPSLRVPLDSQGAMGINWRGQGYKSGAGFEYISLTDVLHGRVDEKLLKGKIGLLGSSSPGLLDLRATPVNAAFPGVEIHALALASMLERKFLTTPPYAVGWEFAALLVMAIIGITGLQRLSPTYAVIMTLGLAAAFLALAEWFRSRNGWIMPIATPLLFLAVIFFLYTVLGYWSESRKKRQFVALFSQYVPPQLVEKMAKNPAQYSMSPREAELTILFSDVRGFTSISEQLSPDDLRDYINQYLSSMSQCISKRDGTLDKFIGDAVMAFWGAPVENRAHASDAVDTALTMLNESRALSQKFVARGWPAMAIGIGLNTGHVRVGDMGSETRRAYTVMGDPVNLASRLESLTKRYGAGLLVGEHTTAQATAHRWLLLDKVRVKGKEAPVRIYTPLTATQSASGDLDTFEANWQTFYSHYLNRQWDWARAQLSLLRNHPPLENLHVPTLIALYEARLDLLEVTEKSDDWQGITNFEEK